MKKVFVKVPEDWAHLTDAQKTEWSESLLGQIRTPPQQLDLVSLGERVDKPDVLRVLERSHGSIEALEEARSQYRSGAWTFLGLQEGDEVVACAGAERLERGTIGIRSIAVEPRWRKRGLGRTLLDGLADRLDADTIVAETDDDAVGFYRRCGFAIEDAPPRFGRPRHRCVRERSRPFDS